jgi:hypothetical protein
MMWRLFSYITFRIWITFCLHMWRLTLYVLNLKLTALYNLRMQSYMVYSVKRRDANIIYLLFE